MWRRAVIAALVTKILGATVTNGTRHSIAETKRGLGMGRGRGTGVVSSCAAREYYLARTIKYATYC